MNFSLKTSSPAKIESDLLVFYSFKGENVENIKGLSPEIVKLISESSKKEKYAGNEGDSLVVSTKGMISSYKVLILGLGVVQDFDMNKLLNAASKAIKMGIQIKASSVGLVVNERWYKQYSAETLGRALVEGSKLGAYRFIKYKSKEEAEKVKAPSEVLISVVPNKISGLEVGINLGKIMSEATIYARDLINEPATKTTPSFLAESAREIDKASSGAVRVKIYEKEEAEKMGMEAFLGVSRGSWEAPKFIVLRYKGAKPKAKVALVGKGITFDSGGLSLKPAEHMETMKMDMSGAAAVLGVFSVIFQLKPKVDVLGVIPACENMPSGRALKPGDILRAANGKTIEVLNTDAEGRLTLADALSFAVMEKADKIIDLATLTGACMVALGQEIAGLWGNDDIFSEQIKKAADKSGEKIWPMPLEKDYDELIKSDLADVKNIQTGRYGGAITAALFLAKFVDKTKWVHLDIAGPAFEERDTSLVPKGGAGFGVRTLLQFLLDY